MSYASNVTALPDRAIRSWGQFATGLSETLVELGRDPDMVSSAIDQLRPIYIKAYEGKVITADASPDDAVAMVNAWVTSILLRLLMDLAEAKIDLIESQERYEALVKATSGGAIVSAAAK